MTVMSWQLTKQFQVKSVSTINVSPYSVFPYLHFIRLQMNSKLGEREIPWAIFGVCQLVKMIFSVYVFRPIDNSSECLSRVVVVFLNVVSLRESISYATLRWLFFNFPIFLRPLYGGRFCYRMNFRVWRRLRVKSDDHPFTRVTRYIGLN